MDSDIPSPNEENNEQKPEFRKPTNEAAHRKYRRRSPLDGLSDEDGSPKHDHSSRRHSKTSDFERRYDDRVDHGRRSDSYRHSKGDRHDEHSRYQKHADEDDRSRAKSLRTDRDSKFGSHHDSRDRESDYNRSRDRSKDMDRCSRDRSDGAVKKYKEKESAFDRLGPLGYDGRRGSKYDDRDRFARGKDQRDDKREYKNSRDYRSDRPTSDEKSEGKRSDFGSKSETGKLKDLDGSKTPVDRQGDKPEDVAAKRPKLITSEDIGARNANETSGSKIVTVEAAGNGSNAVVGADAAKVAAIKAAELVNKNLTGTGLMTADQKKKLLWGSKKSTTADEPSHRWDSAMFSDRERQEKFNKLMSLRLPWYIWPIVGCEGRGEGDLKSCSQPRLGEIARRFGEAIHGRSSTEGRPHCGFRTLKFFLGRSAKTPSVRLHVCLYGNFVDFSVVRHESLEPSLNLFSLRKFNLLCSLEEASSKWLPLPLYRPYPQPQDTAKRK